MTLTSIIAVRNDPLLPKTIESMRQGFDGHIVVVDDASDQNFTATLDPKISIIRNKNRMGPGLSRHSGAIRIPDGWLMFSDSHMEFPADWYKVASDVLINSNESEIWGPVYQQHEITNSFWHDTRMVAGADFYWWKHHDLKFSFIDLAPRRRMNRVEYSVPSLLGGCYFVHTEWFRKMGGFAPMVGYGSEEAWLSWNTWLLGGKVNIIGNLAVTHILQESSGSKRSMIPEWEINRLIVAKRVLSHDSYSIFCSWLPISHLIKEQVEQIAKKHPECFDREFDVTPHQALEVTFNLQSLVEAIDLMKQYKEEMDKLCPACKDRRWLINGPRLAPCPMCNPRAEISPNINGPCLEKIK